jgi:hypothetical protein
VYEVINALLEPLTLFYLLLLVALLNLWRKPRPPRRRLLLMTGAFAGLTVVCCSPMAYLALGSLEWRYPPLEHRPADAQAIVVLSSGVLPPNGPRAHRNSTTTASCAASTPSGCTTRDRPAS